MEHITETEYALLPEDLTKYEITLSLWRLTWQDMRGAQADDAAQRADNGMETLQKALKSCVVTLDDGTRRLMPDATRFPFPLIAAANKLLKKAIEEASDPGN